jgi:hypothetical protein
MVGAEMKVTIVTGLGAKRNMYVNTSHGWKVNNCSGVLFRTLFWMFFRTLPAIAQPGESCLQIVANTSDSLLLFQTGPHEEITDTILLNENIQELQRNGYLLAGVDSLIFTEGCWYAFVYIGRQYEPGKIEWATTEWNFINPRAIRRIKNRSKENPFTRLQRTALSGAENNGYPFARIQWDEIELKEGMISGKLRLDPGPLITYDTLFMTGNSRTKRQFMELFLDLKTGTPYAEKQVNLIDKRIDQLPYVRMINRPQLSFVQEKAVIELALEDRKVSSLDFVLGFFPNQSNDERLLITGLVDLQLQNLFGKGIGGSMKWERFKQESQKLDLTYYHPFPFRMPFSFGLNFNLLKEDSTFSNQSWDIGLETWLGASHLLRLGFERRNSNTLDRSFDQTGLSENLRSTSYDGLKLVYTWKNRISENAVGHGTSLNLIMGLGRRTLRDEGANNPNDTIGEKTLQVSAGLDIQHNMETFNQVYLYTRIHGAYLWNERLFVNESYRLGGLRSFRGFNENFFFTNAYVVNQIELRVHYAYEGYVFLLYDHGFVEPVISGQHSEYVLGTGIGMNISTKSGNFQFIYAFGKLEEGIDARNGKIHFGYVARF